MNGSDGKKGSSPGVMDWIGSACRFATDRNDFRRSSLLLPLVNICPLVEKSLSVPQSLDLAAQVSAVDLGLKPALLYDSNSASADQVQRYLSSLQSSQLVSKSLLTLDLNGNTLIVNPVTVRTNVEQLVHDGSVPVIDVCHSLEKPAIADPLTDELKSMTHDLLLLLREAEEDAEKPHYVGEKSEELEPVHSVRSFTGLPRHLLVRSDQELRELSVYDSPDGDYSFSDMAARLRGSHVSSVLLQRPGCSASRLAAQPGKLEASFTGKISAAKCPKRSHSLSVHSHSAFSLFVMLAYFVTITVCENMWVYSIAPLNCFKTAVL
ncbi:UPF0739 protein C1orf74-like protein [Nibea albiflora]|uniref:UPF0739 protein C1orf74-like protein n=1 Tax=Nibea albiflora TaxID=240163 RepID=A0ACB7EZS8_NIBAL|nr:UPF0739 protein C1orf74-like protein [Nibea albiflora]